MDKKDDKCDDKGIAAAAFLPKDPDCPRCGDLFYHPKTIIEDHRQRSAEWEEIAKKYKDEIESIRQESTSRLLHWQDTKTERDAALAEVKRLRGALAEVRKMNLSSKPMRGYVETYINKALAADTGKDKK